MKRGRRKFSGMMDMFTILIAVMVSGVCTYVQIYLTVHFKHVQFIVCQFYLNKAPFKKQNKKWYQLSFNE